MIARRLLPVGSRWDWVADGSSVFLGNTRRLITVGSRWDWVADVGSVFLVNTIAAVGCRWWRRIVGECNCRLPDTLEGWAEGCTESGDFNRK